MFPYNLTRFVHCRATKTSAICIDIFSDSIYVLKFSTVENADGDILGLKDINSEFLFFYNFVNPSREQLCAHLLIFSIPS